MANLQASVKCSTENNAAAVQYLLCKKRKHAAAGACKTYGIINIFCPIYTYNAVFIRFVQQWANFFAQSAVNAERFINLRIAKAFFVILHCNTAFGAD